MSNKKKISYEDYKYVYTGYKDYCKNHNIKIKTTQEKKKEVIAHNHNFEFDFNNPNQHTHDYSYDLPDVQNKTTNNSNNKTNTSYKKQTSYYQNRSSSTPTVKTTTIYQTNKNNKSGCGCVVAFIIVFIIIFFISIFASIIDSYDDNYYDDYYYEETTDSYENAVNTYLDAVENLDYTLLIDRITDEEYKYDNGATWENDINNIYQKINSYNINYFYYAYTSTDNLSYEYRNNIQNSFNNKYNSNVIFNDAYSVTLKISINNTYIYKYLTIAEIDDYWYLINVI